MDEKSEALKAEIRKRIEYHRARAKVLHEEYGKDWWWHHKLFYCIFGRPPGLVKAGQLHDAVWIELDDLDTLNMELSCREKSS